MKIIYKTFPYGILLFAAGILIGMAGGETVWGYIGIGLMIAPVALTLGAVLVVTCIHWRKNKATTDKRLSEVSVTLIFNAGAALLLFGYLTWKDIEILYVDNILFILWAAINLGALRVLWVPKEDDTNTEASIIDGSKEDKNKEAV
jgi:hypothetical protein